MGTLIAVVAVSFASAVFTQDAINGHLVQVHAVAQALCTAQHAAGVAHPLRGMIGARGPEGAVLFPAALFGCYVPDDAPPTPAPQTFPGTRRGA